MIRTALLLLLLAAPALAQQEAAPSESPRPRTAPDNAAPEDATSADDVPEANPSTASTNAPSPPGLRDTLRLDDVAYAACLADLDALEVDYAEAEPVTPENDADCGILRPLSIREIAPGIALSSAPLLRCATARAMARWTRDFVLPAADRLSDRGALQAIRTGPGYTCRRRNNAETGKLSEHAFGNAIDVLGFSFTEASAIAIQPREADGSLAEAFQDAVRASACLEFTTVLGPGSDAAHDNHLHLDIVERSRGYRLCEQGGATPD